MLTNQVGDPVYVRGPMNGGYKVDRVDPTNTAKMPAIGVIIAKWGFTDCLIQLWGEARSLYSGLVPGETYFVGPSGAPTLAVNLPLPTTGNRYYLQVLGVALDVAILLVKPAETLAIRVG